MDCKTAHVLLEAYLDGELERADARAVEAHLDGCADCRDALTRLDGLRRALRENGLRHAAPASLHARLRDTDLRAATRPRVPTRSAPAWLRYAAACVLAFGAGAGGVYLWNPRQSASAALERDLFASHWRALAAASPVDVVSSDRHTVKPWFAGKLAQSPIVRDFADQGFPLVGGRIDYVGDMRVPVLVYRHGQHLIDVFVLGENERSEIGEAAEREGYTLEVIASGGQPAAVVSDMDAQELARFIALARGS
ncbi:MAG TPA: anti-sigma factor [Rudaea sp.]|nr:anti-sigma factor [Rudaea sp.]